MTTQAEWYYSRGGTQAGPVPVMNLRDMVMRGQLTLDDLVWSEGMPSWLAIRQVPALQAMFAPSPPSAPPASPLNALPGVQPGVQPQQQYAPPGYGMQYGTANYGYQSPVGESSNGMAIAGFVLSFLFAPLGLIFSIIALKGMKRTGNPEGKGLATAGLVISIVFTSIWCLYLIVFFAFIGSVARW